MDIIYLLLFTLLVRISTQQCGTGCLMCSSGNVCILCDITNKYVLNGSSCALSTIQNCSVLLLNGSCAICSSGFFSNPKTGTCIQVTASSTVSNCLVYDTTQVCVLCAQNFYISQGQCIQVTSAVSNCLYYSSTAQCMTCASGFIFSNDYTSCVAQPTIANCQSYSYIVCTICKTGYYQNFNNYLSQFFSTATGLYDQLILSSTSVGQMWIPQIECVSHTTVSNCIAYQSNNDTCTNCAVGYFLTGNNCIQNPVSIIIFCSIYSSYTTCTVCIQGYYLSSATICLPITPITNCQSYDGSQSFTACLVCVNGFYVSSNACVARISSLSITNCATITTTADTCQACDPTFVLTTDGLGCLASLPNCALYSASSRQTTTHSCLQCVDGYYLGSDTTANLCVQGTIQFCKTYTNNQNNCVVCNNGYYLQSPTSCIAHLLIPDCKTYSQLVANNCILCNTGYFNFNFTNICNSVTLISQCQTYAPDGKTCTQCNTGYYVTSTGSCSSKAIIAQCNTFKPDGTCLYCDFNYVLVSNACISPYDFYTSGCANYDFTFLTTGLNNALCNHCSSNTGPYNLQQQTTLCVLTSQLVSYLGTFSSITGCVKYSSYGKCMECTNATPYLMVQAIIPALVCQATCPTGNALIFNNLDGYVNLCVTTTYMQPMDGEGAEVQPTFLCKTIARVGWSNEKIIGQNQGLTLGSASATNPTSTTTEPLTSDYVCITPSDSTGTGTAYDQQYFSTVLIERLQHWKFGLFSNQPYKINDLSSALTSVLPSAFAYNGFGITPISGVSGNSLQTGRVYFTENCALYMKYSSYYIDQVRSVAPTIANVYYCNMCKFSFQLSITCGTSTSKCTVITPSCSSFSACSQTVYTGFPSYLNMILSCHLCNDASLSVAFSQQATVYDPATMSKSFVGFGLTVSNGQATTIINCLAITPNPIVNCLVYGFAAAGASSDPGSSNRYCVSCKPGYSPLDSDPYLSQYSPAGSVPGGKITQCDQITNCAPGNTMVNGCTACVNKIVGQNPPYYTFANTFYNKCVQVTTDNCFMTTSAISQQCKVCKPGYFLNYDSQCETLSLPNCSQITGQSEYQLTKSLALLQENIRIYLGLSFFGRMNGCKLCNSGYTRVQGKNHFLCVPSTYVQLNSYTQSSSYTGSCSLQTFSSQDTVQCQPCSAGQRRYSLQSTIAACRLTTELASIGITAITDCMKYNASGKCNECGGANPILMLTTGTISCSNACVNTSGTPFLNAIIYDNLDGRVRACVLSAYIQPMAGEGTTAVLTNQCEIFARVGWTNSDALGSTFSSSVGATGEPAASDYICVKEYAYTLGAGPNYSTNYFKTITKGRLVDASIGLFSYQPYKFGETINLSPSLIGYNGLGFTPIVGHVSNTNNQANKVFFNADCATFLKYDAAYIASVASVNPVADTYLCNQCRFQFQLKLTCTTLTLGKCTEITPSCVDQTATYATTFYSGFPAYLNAILSVHTCPSGESLIFQQQSSNYDPSKMDTTYVGFQLITTQGTMIWALQCISITTAPVADCLVNGMGMDANFNIISKYCVSCKPGYSPADSDPYFSTVAKGGQVTSCTAITNCQAGSTMANGCTACETIVTDQNPTYYAFASDRYNKCVQVTTDNCFIATSATSQQCKICKHGFFLSYENQCETLALSNCSTVKSDILLNNSNFGNNARAYLGLSKLSTNSGMLGCTACASGYTRVQRATSTICVASSYISNFSYVTTTYYIANCQSYTPLAASSLQCKVCLGGYIPNDTYKNCAAQTIYPNCAVFLTSSGSACHTCNINYVLINSSCVKMDIANCLTHLTVNPTKLQCQTCFQGFVLSTDFFACTAGIIPNCATYQQGQSSVCQTCFTGYTLLTTVSNGHYCYWIPPSANCTALTASTGTGLKIGQFYCTACPASTNSLAFGLTSFSSISNYQQRTQSICLLFPIVANCISYGSTFSITDTRLTCTGCASNFYLNTGQNACLVRKNTHSACLSYNPDADQCTSCSSAQGTFLNTTTWTCTSFPNGIFQCNTYQSLTVCTQCNAPYYLSNNECLLSTTVANCALYSSNNTCSQCVSNYVLVNSTYCQAAVAQNCYTYTDINTCASCDPNNNNFGLQTNSNLITNCVTKNIANCVVSTNVSPFLCTQCIAGFFPNSGICESVQTTIVNCFNYDSASTCLECHSPFVLNTSRTQCLQIQGVDVNCKFLNLLSSANCSMCNIHFWFQSGSCVSCPNSLTTGCYGCHPKGGSACISCSPGYYMTMSGICLSVSGQNVTTIPTTNITNINFNQNTAVPSTTTTSSSTSSSSTSSGLGKMQMLISVVFFMILLF